MRNRYGFIVCLALVIVGCGNPPTEIASNQPDRPSAAWMRGVNLSSESVTVTSQKFSLMTNADAGSGTSFTPVPPKAAKVTVKLANGKSSEVEVSPTSDKALTLVVTSEGSTLKAVSADLGEARNAKAGTSLVAFVVVDGEKVTAADRASVSIDGAPASGTEMNGELKPGAHKATIQSSAGPVKVDLDLEDSAAYTVFVQPKVKKATVVRNTGALKPSSQGAG